MPAISVILACYNTERYIASAVKSILAQTFGDFELILINDGSTDRSTEICKSLAAQDNRIRLISRPNKGLTKTLNEGLALATAPLIARMDADDISLPTRFEKQVAYLNANPDCVCVGSRVTLIDPYDSPISVTDHKLIMKQIDADLLKGIGWSIVHPAAMMRTDAVQARRRISRAIHHLAGPGSVAPACRDRQARESPRAAGAISPAFRIGRQHKARSAVAGEIANRRRRLRSSRHCPAKGVVVQ